MQCLFDNYSPAIYGLIRRIIDDEKIASEILETCFLNILTDIKLYDRKKSALFTWMINSARNTITAYLQSARFSIPPVQSILPMLPASNPDQPDIRQLPDYINDIPLLYRAVLELSLIRKYSTLEISRLLQLPPDIVNNRIEKGCAELQRLNFIY